MLKSLNLRGRLMMKLSDIEKMSVGEKLQAIDMLWNALDDDDVELPEWHHDVLDARVKELESGQAKYESLDALKRRKLNG